MDHCLKHLLFPLMCHEILALALAKESRQKDAEDSPDEDETFQDSMLGINTFAQERRAQIARASTWIESPFAKLDVAAFVVLTKPLMELHHRLFHLTKHTHKSDGLVFEFLDPLKSPATECVVRLTRLVRGGRLIRSVPPTPS